MEEADVYGWATAIIVMFILLTWCAPARAQALIEYPPSAASGYTLRFLAYANTATVCLFQVNASGTVAGVDRDGDGTFDRDDALGCTLGPLVSDGSTANSYALTLATMPTSNLPVAAMAYAASGSALTPSPFSNRATLLAPLRAPILVAP